jgi:O-methyltransferase
MQHPTGIFGNLAALERKLHRRGWTPWKRWDPLVPERQFTGCVDEAITALLADHPTDDLGCYLEFGVSRGTSMACVHEAFRARGISIRLIGFDSFEGLPAEAADQGWHPGQYSSSRAATRRYLRRRGVPRRRVDLVEGWFDETLTEQTRSALGIDRVSLIMIDCDIYSSTATALRFCVPHIDRTVVMFDDWGWRDGAVGQREAFEEMLHEHPEFVATPLPSYLDQARVFMVTRTSS